MPQGEVVFNALGKGTGDDYHGEIALPSKRYEWEDKYRPRKPRFFNRVKTGYEWNKYNQTHYDHDNPPPKQVQGYKFNREWILSSKFGFRIVFDRGVLQLYFNFKRWRYRR